MTDIALTWDYDNREGAWTVDDSGLVEGYDLYTSVLISLFTDRVDPDYIGPGGRPDHRGWWADLYEISPIGSRLWQLLRAKITDRASLLLRVNDFSREALAWMISSGVVSSVGVSSRYTASDAIEINITLTEPTLGKQVFSYSWAWGAN